MPNDDDLASALWEDDASVTRNSYVVSPRGQGFFYSTIIQFSKHVPPFQQLFQRGSLSLSSSNSTLSVFFRIVLVAQKKKINNQQSTMRRINSLVAHNSPLATATFSSVVWSVGDVGGVLTWKSYD